MFPTNKEYETAVQNLDKFVLDPAFKGGMPRRIKGKARLEMYSGGFARVFPIDLTHTNKTLALRCWIADIGNEKKRYEEIDNYLRANPLPYFVEFAYVPNGIFAGGKKYPIIRMEWAQGFTLKKFIGQYINKTQIILETASTFQRMVKDLHEKQISHGDLQEGNIVIYRNGNAIQIKLIDYDSLFVPRLTGFPDQIVGLPAYQHPSRINAKSAKANKRVDYFSELVIYLSLRCFAEQPKLWQQFHVENADGLLFSKEDFEKPNASDVYRELTKLSDEVKNLAAWLQEFCSKKCIDDLLPLEDVINEIQNGTVPCTPKIKPISPIPVPSKTADIMIQKMQQTWGVAATIANKINRHKAKGVPVSPIPLPLKIADIMIKKMQRTGGIAATIANKMNRHVATGVPVSPIPVPSKTANTIIQKMKQIGGVVTPAPIQQVQIKPPLSYWMAIVRHLFFGRGLLYVAHDLFRGRVYPLIFCYAILDLFLIGQNVEPFGSDFSAITLAISFLIYIVSFIDVILTCRKRK